MCRQIEELARISEGERPQLLGRSEYTAVDFERNLAQMRRELEAETGEHLGWAQGMAEHWEEKSEGWADGPGHPTTPTEGWAEGYEDVKRN